VLTGAPDDANAQVIYQDFTVPSVAVASAAFAFDVYIYGYYNYEYSYNYNNICFQDVETLEPSQPNNAFRVDIIASNGDMFGDSGANMGGDAADGGGDAAVDAGSNGGAGAASPEVFTSPVLFELFAPSTSTYGIQHIVVDGAALAGFLDSHQGETLRLRVGAVSSTFPVMGRFDNVSLKLGI
jgi:hypothetical protein